MNMADEKLSIAPNNRDKVSVIIPSYDRADLIGFAIQSVLGQEYQNFEILVVDDGSKDETRSVVESFHDPRVNYLYQQNAGLSAARNTGIANAEGRYITFLDSDDFFLPNKLVNQVQQFEQNEQLGFVSSGFYYVDWVGRKLAVRYPWIYHPEIDLELILLGCEIVPIAVMIRREWIDQVGGFNPVYRRAEDFDMWIRLAVAGCKMAWTPSVLCSYRMHPGQAVRNVTQHNKTTMDVYESFFQRQDLSNEIISLKPKVFSSLYIAGASREYSAGLFKEAQKSLCIALELNGDWAANDFKALRSTLIGWAANPLMGGAVHFIDKVLKHLPQEARNVENYRLQLILEAGISAAMNAISVGNSELAEQYLANMLQMEAEIKWQSGNVVEVLVDRLRSYPMENRLEILENFIVVANGSFPAIKHQGSKAVSRYYMAQGFEAQDHGDGFQAGRSMVAGVLHDPAWLTNRGVLATLARYGWNRLMGRAMEKKE